MIDVDRKAAVAAAERELTVLGFTRGIPIGDWLEASEGEGGARLSVRLPQAFPYSLPSVFVDRLRLPRRIAHVERSGKVCIASSNGLLLNVGRPEGLVKDAIERARKTIAEGLRGENDEDLWAEFGAYWMEQNARELLTVCAPDGSSRLIALGQMARPKELGTLVAADSAARLRAIATRLALKLTSVESAWFIRLRTPILPPLFEQRTNLRFITDLIRDGVSALQFDEILRTTAVGQVRLTFVFSFSIPNRGGNALFSWRLKTALSSNGFRTGRLPLGAGMSRSGLATGERLSLQRADPEFLISRTSGVRTLVGKRVAIIGCGAVGGHLAACLADSGVEALTLIDDDLLRPENAMRHLLGFAHVGSRKVSALRRMLQARNPHLEVHAREQTVEVAMAEDPELGGRHDLIIFATGDHTLELGVSGLLRKQTALLHTWVEAHGIGGHVLVDGRDGRGCIGCLVVEDEVHGLRCPASFFEPGQDFTCSVGGCAGTFTPFGSMDAQRAAIEAARVALRVLSGEISQSVLVSWFEGAASARARGLVLSERASLFSVGQRIEVTAHAGCPRCMP